MAAGWSRFIPRRLFVVAKQLQKALNGAADEDKITKLSGNISASLKRDNCLIFSVFDLLYGQFQLFISRQSLINVSLSSEGPSARIYEADLSISTRFRASFLYDQLRGEC